MSPIEVVALGRITWGFCYSKYRTKNL